MPKSKQQQAHVAKLLQVLEYVDGPQAVLLERSADYKIVAVQTDQDGGRYAFFGAAISHEQWERYRRGLLDLRYLFMFPRWRQWFTFDLSPNMEEVVPLKKAERDATAEEQYVPEAGFFAYDHSERIDSLSTEGLAKQTYKTDGHWDIPDFTEFYNKITELYVFSLSLKKFLVAGAPVQQKRRIRQAFEGHPLRGGSSYRNLYSDLMTAQSLDERLSVSKLHYASPGNIDVRGRLDIFTEVSVSLTQFEKNYDALKHSYNALHSYLSRSKLLKKEAIVDERFDKDGAVADHILKLCNQFAAELALENPRVIYRLTKNHALKYAKILLAHYRRLDSYFMFFAEGRVKDPQTIEPEEE